MRTEVTGFSEGGGTEEGIVLGGRGGKEKCRDEEI